MKTNPFLPLALHLAWLMTPVLASADELRPIAPRGPVLVATDVTSPSETHRIRLLFPAFNDVDSTSLGDGDLHLLGRDGFEERAQFVDFTLEDLPLPLALDSLPSGADPFLIPQPAPVLVATYRFDGPGGNWAGHDNGIYRVRLAEDAITRHDGSPFETMFLGGFRCAIDDPNPRTIQPTETRIVFYRDLVDGKVRYLTDVVMTFQTPHVRVVQGDLERTGNRFLAPIEAYRLPVPDLDIPPQETSADRLAGIPPEDIIAPFAHRVTLTYRLGPLEAGTYGFLARMNRIPEANDSFTVPTDPPVDQEAPEAELAARNVTEALEKPHQFSVTYADNSGIDLGTLGDGDVMVLSPCLNFTSLIADPCPSDWKAQRARLVNVIPLDRRLLKVRVIYEVEPPNGAWTAAANGFYPVVWRENEVCDAPGNCNRYQRLGGFEVAINDSNPPIKAEAEIRIDSSDPANVVARVAIAFRTPHRLVQGEVTRDGHRIRLDAKAEPLPVPLESNIRPPIPAPVVLEYRIGEFEPGGYLVGYFMNDFRYATDNIVISDPGPQIEATVRLSIDQSDKVNTTGHVRIRFATPHVITGQNIRRLGNRFIFAATARPVEDANLVRVAEFVDLEFPLGDLEGGDYSAAFVMNGYPYETVTWTEPEEQFRARVEVVIEEGGHGNWVAKARIEFANPQVRITDPGEVIIDGSILAIKATAELTDALDVPGPFEFTYDLGELPAGRYLVVYSINGNFEARATFAVPEICEPLPHLVSIRDGEENGQWFTKVALALTPGQQVLNWGTLRQSENEFHVNITVACLDSDILPVPVDPVPGDELPDGFLATANGEIIQGGLPVRLVSHLYRLGELESGNYQFFVHSQGITLGSHRFAVEGDPPKVELSVGPITAEAREHHFAINFSDRSGLDHDSIQGADVWITGPDNYREQAILVDYASTDDDPSTSGFGRYSVNGPDGSWDRPDNGGYRIFIDADMVHDLQGNSLQESYLGSFRVSILPQIEPGVTVTFSRSEEGNWLANVTLLPPPDQALVVDSWGPLVLHGHSFVALATVHTEIVTKPTGPLTHSYDLGPLQPGYYVFVFKTNLAHCGIGELTVPGVEGAAIDRWLGLTGDSPDDARRFANYFFASRTPDLRAAIVGEIPGKRHLGIRFRRLTGAEGVSQKVQASRDLAGWDDVTDSVDLVERTIDIDGTEKVLLCLRQTMAESPYRYLRIVVEVDE